MIGSFVLKEVVEVKATGRQPSKAKKTKVPLSKQFISTNENPYAILQSLVLSFRDSIFSVNRDYCYTSFNRNHASVMKSLYGVDIQLGKNLMDYITVREDRKKAKINFDRVLLKGQKFREEAYYGDESSSRRYFEVSHSPITDPAGEVIGVLVMSRDITKHKKAGEALREGEERYHTIFNEARDGIALFDLDTGQLHDCNPEYERQTGRKLEQLKKMKMWELRPPQMVRAARVKFLEIKEKGSGGSAEFAFERPDGEIVPIEFKAKVVSIAGKRYLQTISRDITERKQAEEKLQHLNNVIRAIRNVNQLITREKDASQFLKGICDNLVESRGFYHAWIARLDINGKLIATAESGLGGLSLIQQRLRRGWLPDCGRKALSQPDVIVVDDRSSTCGDCPLAGMTGTAMAVRLEYGGKVYGFLKASVPAQLVIEAEELSLFRELGTDIAFALNQMELEERRKQTEEALKESEEKYHALFSEAGDGIALFDLETGQLLDCNPEYERQTGRKLKQLKKMRVWELRPPQMVQAARVKFLEAKQKGTCSFAELPFMKPDGEIVHIEVRAGVVSVRGKRYLQGISRDVTERKLAEDKLKENEQRLRDAMGLGRIGYWEFDIETLRISWSDETFVLYERDPSLGAPTVEEEATYYSPEQAEKLGNYVFSAIEERKVVNYDFVVALPSGKSAYMTGSLRPVMDYMGRVVKVVGVFHDITERKKAEEALRESEARYRLLADNVTDVIWTMDMNLQFTYISPSVTRQRGYSVEEAMALGAEGTLTPESLDRATNLVLSGLSEDAKQRYPSRSWTVELELYCKDGSTIWTEMEATFLRGADGKPTEILGVSRDITERRKAQQALQRSEARFRGLVETGAAGIASVNVKGDLTYLNQTMCDMAGYPLEELLGKPFMQFLHPDDVENVVRLFTDAVAGARTQPLLEFRLMHKDGHAVWCYTSPTALEYGSDELYFVAIITDVTERKLAEDMLRKSEENYRLLAENVTDVIWTMDMDFRFTFISPSVMRLRGLTVEEAMAERLEDIFPPSSLQALVEGFKEGIVAEAMGQRDPSRSWTVKLEECHKDGSLIWVEIRAGLLRDQDGQPVGLVGVTRDITERKLAEDRLRESEQRFRLASQIANDQVYERDARTGVATFYGDIDALMGYGPGEFPRTVDGWTDYVHPEDVSKVAEQIRKQAGQGDTFIIEYRLRRKDGTYRYLIDRFTNVWDDKREQTVKIIGVATDITERKLAEQALQQREQDYRLLLESTHDSIMVVDAETLKVVFGNRRALLMFGFDPVLHDEVGVSILDFVYPEDREIVIKGFMEDVYHQERRQRYDVRVKTRDGREIWVSALATRVEFQGRVAVLLSVKDVTQTRLAEQALRESEMRFRTISDKALTGIYIIQDGHLTYVNPALAKIFGYEPDELIGADPLVVIHPDDHARTTETMRRRFAGEMDNISYEFRGRCKNGETRNVEVLGTRVDLNNRAAIMGNIVDITERKQAEKALRESKAHYSTLVESLTDAVFRVKDGVITWCNDRVEEIYGYTKDELVGKKVGFLFPEGVSHAEFLKKASAAIRERGFLLGTGSIKRKDGSKVDIDYSISLIPGEGPIELVAVGRDVTDRKQAEDRLKESEAKYSRLVEAASEGIWSIDTEHRTTYMNPRMAEMLGYRVEDIIGRNADDFIVADELPNHKEQMELRHTGKSAKYERRFKRADGSTLYCFVSAVADHDEYGRFRGSFGMFTDITERKQAEEKRKEMEQKAAIASRLAAVGEMAAGIAHEINNPLTSVIGYSELLEHRTDLPADIKEDIKIINDGSQRVKDIVNRMLTFARQTKPMKSSVSITELIDNTLELRGYALRTANIEVIRDYEPDLPWLTIDPSQMQQVILNITVNAEYAMKKANSRGTLTITARKAGDRVQISFKDDGPGMTKEIQTRLFQPFFTTKEPSEGSGLGLSLSRAIILEHGGTIVVESKPGQGATFIIELPITGAPSLEASAPTTAAKMKPATMKNAKILVVDDESSVRGFIDKVLTRSGCSVDTTGDPKEALDKLAGATYDALIIDIRMPGMSGPELYARILERTPALAKRVIFITGDAMGTDVKAFLTQNSLSYLAKPFDIKALEAKVSSILEVDLPENGSPEREYK